jgi:16S rRNA (uracil1498-N3)-methyltransferase
VQRFFVPPERLKNREVEFGPEQSHQLARVLRLQPGERVAVLDNAGWLYDVELTEVGGPVARAAVRSRHLASGEPRTKLTVYPALIKSDKLEFVLQKCTELGVAAFAPTVAARSVVGATTSELKQERWERIIAEAAEQSERGRLPQLFPVGLLAQAFEEARGLSFIAAERGDRRSLRQELAERADGRGSRPFTVNLFVGPEGGFAPEELDLAASYGIVPVGLGPRILRAETAAIVAATIILAETGDLD